MVNAGKLTGTGIHPAPVAGVSAVVSREHLSREVLVRGVRSLLICIFLAAPQTARTQTVTRGLKTLRGRGCLVDE